MNTATVIDTLDAYARNALSDQALVQRIAAWRRKLPDGVDELRSIWPAEQYPVVGPYLCVGNLGKGTSGVVYRAVHVEDAKTPQLVAVKLLRLDSDEGRRRFFDREVQILRGLRCPHVARFLDSGTAQGTPYLVMELVPGTRLDWYLATRSLNLDDKLRLFEKVAAAIAELHDAGVVHRDLNPQHIIVDENGEPYIIDLGLSAARSDDWAAQIRRTQTQLGGIVGTPRYMSPEQAWGGLLPIDYRTDIWALGIMLFEIATDGGYPYSLEPLEGKNLPDSLVHRIQNEVPARPVIRDERYASGLLTLIGRCLAHEPRRRIDSARVLAEDIARLRARQRIATRPLPLTYRVERIAIGLALRARLALWSLCVLGTVITIFAAVFLLNVHWVVKADGYSASTRQRLALAGEPRGGIDFVIGGISDKTLWEVPRFAANNGLAGVTPAVTTWRGVHGAFMERLAEARPLMLVLDYHYDLPQPQDPEFVRGVRALDAVNVPVVVAVNHIDTNGLTNIAPTIRDPLGDVLHSGLAVARDMVIVPGEYLVGLRDGERTYPSLYLAAFGALCYPQCRSELHWPALDKEVQLRYRKRDETNYLAALDDISVHSRMRSLGDRGAERVGNQIAYTAVPLVPVDDWKRRTVPYEVLLRASPERLADMVGGRILVIGGTLSPLPLLSRDLHSVRYPTGIEANVPGVYLVANGIKGLLEDRHRVFHMPLLGQSFGVIIGSAVGALVLAGLFSRRLYTSPIGRRTAWPATAACVAAASVCLWWMSVADSPARVRSAIACAALLLTLTPALGIERIRRTRRVHTHAPPTENPSGDQRQSA